MGVATPGWEEPRRRGDAVLPPWKEVMPWFRRGSLPRPPLVRCAAAAPSSLRRRRTQFFAPPPPLVRCAARPSGQPAGVAPPVGPPASLSSAPSPLASNQARETSWGGGTARRRRPPPAAALTPRAPKVSSPPLLHRPARGNEEPQLRVPDQEVVGISRMDPSRAEHARNNRSKARISSPDSPFLSPSSLTGEVMDLVRRQRWMPPRGRCHTDWRR